MVYLYAAIAEDPKVGRVDERDGAHHHVRGGRHRPVLRHPVGHHRAAVKQGWGDDGNDSPNAVFNSTGYVVDAATPWRS